MRARSPRPASTPGRGPRQSTRGPRLVMVTAAISILAAAAITWSGCTVTPDNYKRLSRFFDGVPDPNVVIAADGSESGPAQRMPSLSIHEPYAKEACAECHNTGIRLSRDSSSMCLKCHEKVPDEHAQMHGPVAAGACLWCHSPHESPYKHLMRDADHKICAQCHTPSLLDATRVPAHAEVGRSCLECHFGHGGPERYQLRPGIAGATSPPAEK
jgi:predicted CXXCH cytochrome family protein